MKNIKTRYKLVLLNIILTILYYLIVRLMIISNSSIQDGEGIFDIVLDILAASLLIIQYLWINVFWILALLYGIIKRKKEFIFGGVYSILLSTGIFIILFYI